MVSCLLVWWSSGCGRSGGGICLAGELGLMAGGWGLLATGWGPLFGGDCWTVPGSGDCSWIAREEPLAWDRAEWLGLVPL